VPLSSLAPAERKVGPIATEHVNDFETPRC